MYTTARGKRNGWEESRAPSLTVQPRGCTCGPVQHSIVPVVLKCCSTLLQCSSSAIGVPRLNRDTTRHSSGAVVRDERHTSGPGTPLGTAGQRSATLDPTSGPNTGTWDLGTSATLDLSQLCGPPYLVTHQVVLLQDIAYLYCVPVLPGSPVCSLWGPDNASGVDETVCFNIFHQDCREAALRRPPPYRHVTCPLTPEGASATECSEEDTDASEVPVTTSLCYAALVLFTALLALSTGLVLFRLVPNANENSRSHSPAQGLRANSESYRHHLCDVVFYTHCPRTAREFCFRGATNSCVRAAASYGTEVCNRSPNKFASSCLRSCVHASRPSGRCLDRPVFSQCRSTDLKRQLWFFEGETCRLWDFPSGKCPMADGDLFGSREDCVHKCLKNETYLSLCRTPPSGTCTTHHLKVAVDKKGRKRVELLSTSELPQPPPPSDPHQDSRRLCVVGWSVAILVTLVVATCATLGHTRSSLIRANQYPTEEDATPAPL
ncbi:hypothetical protein HPB50_004352 [Hyalomma asiaticum]|uniref:Uncharacterized protein n=1 Tax=Hyalomma asiaticum TaxID=266040 RepID=A0ACB7T5Y0_HYAAI|nr:hypothetical protein HPB50_004352 [Hyalomma asiaticum]